MAEQELLTLSMVRRVRPTFLPPGFALEPRATGGSVKGTVESIPVCVCSLELR